MDDAKLINLLIGEPIELLDGIYVNVPTVRDFVEQYDEYQKHVTALTVMTRQIFVEARQVDAIESKYPTIWELMCEPNFNLSLGGITGQKGKKLSDLIIDAIAFWTNLDSPSQELVNSYTEEDKKTKPMGFKFLENNGKIINYDSQWVIDKREFTQLVDVIKIMMDWRQPDNLAPRIGSDNAHATWLNMYKNERRANKKNEKGIVDQIIIAQVMTPSFLKINDILDMTVFNFKQLFRIIGEKDAYQASMDIAVSPKFSSGKDGQVKFPTDWKSKYKVSNKIN